MLTIPRVGYYNDVIIDCPEWNQLSPFQLIVGCGAYGCIYKAPEELSEAIKEQYGTSDVVAKITIFDWRTANELTISKILGSIGIGPKIYDSLECGKHLAIIMEQMDITLADYLGEFNPSIEIRHWIYNRIEEKVKHLHDEVKYFHHDLHMKNIMLKFNQDTIQDVYLIDFGTSRPIYDNLIRPEIQPFTIEESNKLSILGIDSHSVNFTNIYFVMYPKMREVESLYNLNQYNNSIVIPPEVQLLLDKKYAVDFLTNDDMTKDSRSLHTIKQQLS